MCCLRALLSFSRRDPHAAAGPGVERNLNRSLLLLCRFYFIGFICFEILTDFFLWHSSLYVLLYIYFNSRHPCRFPLIDEVSVLLDVTRLAIINATVATFS